MGDQSSPSSSEPEFTPDFDFEASFERLRDAPCFPTKLTLRGLKRTNREVVRRELLRVKEASTLDEVKDAILGAYQDLMALGIFDAVDIVIDKGTDRVSDSCSIDARFSEKSLLQMHTGTYVQGQEGSVEASASVTNPFGHAERFSLSGEWGSQSTTMYSLGVARTRPRGLPFVASAKLHQLFTSSQRWSSFTELLRGGEASLSTEDGRHAVSCDLAWYRLADPTRQASRAVQQQFGDGVRTAVKYIFRHSTLEGDSFPVAGWGVSSSSEVGGHGSGAALGRFFKQRGAAQLALPLGDGASLTLAAEAGVLLPLSTRAAATPSSITDRFFVGGLGGTSLRGFAQRGVGPTDVRRPPPETGVASTTAAPPAGARTRDALGGDLFCTLYGALNFELPFEAARAAGMYAHLFVNGGNLVGLGRDWRAEAAGFSSGFRWSVGTGIVWPTRVGKLELNVSRVLRSQEHDRVKAGLQFGFSPPAF